MGIIIAYLSFCLATSLVAWGYLFWPTVRQARSLGVRNDITRSPYLSSIVYIILCTLFAPILIFIIFIPDWFASAREGITKSIYED
jgi:hypothetical protein